MVNENKKCRCGKKAIFKTIILRNNKIIYNCAEHNPPFGDENLKISMWRY